MWRLAFDGRRTWKGDPAVPLASGYFRTWERDLPIPYRLTRTELQRSGLKANRKKWRRPNCRRRFRVLVDYDPQSCPACEARLSLEAPPTARARILIESPDPLVELLSQVTGRRISSRRLLKSSILLALLVGTLVVGFLSAAPLVALGRQLCAYCDLAKGVGTVRPADDLEPVTNLGIVPVIRLPEFAGVSRRIAANPVEPAKPLAPASDRPSGAAAGSVGNQIPSDPEFAAVRAWLKIHRDGENLEVIKWWPAKKVDDDLVNYAGLLKTDRVARLQYRDNQADAAQLVRDEIFVIRDNKARAVPAGENWWWDDWGGWTQLIIRGAAGCFRMQTMRKRCALAIW